jgi:hypothetical protein
VSSRDPGGDRGGILGPVTLLRDGSKRVPGADAIANRADAPLHLRSAQRLRASGPSLTRASPRTFRGRGRGRRRSARRGEAGPERVFQTVQRERARRHAKDTGAGRKLVQAGCSRGRRSGRQQRHHVETPAALRREAGQLLPAEGAGRPRGREVIADQQQPTSSWSGTRRSEEWFRSARPAARSAADEAMQQGGAAAQQAVRGHRSRRRSGHLRLFAYSWWGSTRQVRHGVEQYRRRPERASPDCPASAFLLPFPCRRVPLCRPSRSSLPGRSGC